MPAARSALTASLLASSRYRNVRASMIRLSTRGISEYSPMIPLSAWGVCVAAMPLKPAAPITNPMRPDATPCPTCEDKLTTVVVTASLRTPVRHSPYAMHWIAK
jgi:hypothetical protein